MSIKALWDERLHAAAELRSLYDSASGRELTAEETQVEERLNKALATIDERVSTLIEERNRQDDIEAAMDKAGFERRQAEQSGGPLPASVIEERALRSFFAGETSTVSFAPATAEERAVQVTTAQPGNINKFYDQLLEHLTEHSTVLQSGQATIIRTESGAPIQVPRTTGFSSASLIGENAAVTESNPTFDTITLDAYKFGFLSGLSSELASDNYINYTEFLVRQGGRALGDGLGTYLIGGTGTNQPNGIKNCTPALTGSTSLTIVFDDLIDLEHSIVSGYRKRGSFIVNDSTVKVLRKIKDLNGQYIWQPSVTAGVPDTILTHPVYTDPNMPVHSVAGNAAVIFGDLSCYAVRFVGPVRIDRSVEYGFANDLIYYRFLFRADGDILDPNGIRSLKIKA